MKYSKKQIGEELKKLILQKVPVAQIANWAYELYLDYPDAKDIQFNRMVLALGMMGLGEEHALSYEELQDIAEDLVSGREVDIKKHFGL